MNFHRQPGLFDLDERAAQLTALGDPLVTLKAEIDFEDFRADLNRVREKERKSNAGAKPFDVVLMFKVLILQHLYNLSDDGLEYQIRDRLSFMRFLGLQMEHRVPDAKTVWLFREQLKALGLVEVLFGRFNEQLARRGYVAKTLADDRRDLYRSAAPAQQPGGERPDQGRRDSRRLGRGRERPQAPAKGHGC
jgi:transposase